MSDLQTWQKIAVLGLNNHNDELPVSEQIAAIYPENTTVEPVKRFLDLAVLSCNSTRFATLPIEDDFDELPPLINESSATIPDRLAKQFESRANGYALHGMLFALYQKELHLPERWLQAALNACGSDKSLPAMLRMVISEKLRWLAQLNPEWHKFLADDDKPSNLPLPLQLAWLTKQPKENLLEVFKEHWFSAMPSDAAHWIACYHVLSKEELQIAAELTSKERSRKTRRVVSRLLAVNNINDLQQQAISLLKHFLSNQSKLLRSSVQISLPEELTAELKALNINDYDYTGLNLPKPVLRLGQLMVLAGIDGIATCLNKSSVQSYKAIISSDFSQELSPFLLEAALWSKNTEMLALWSKSYKNKKKLELSWENILSGIDNATVNCLITQMVEHNNSLWMDDEFFKHLYAHHVCLDNNASDAFVQYLAKELKHGLYYGGLPLLLKMFSLISYKSLEPLQTILAESSANFTEELLTVLRFRLALENNL